MGWTHGQNERFLPKSAEIKNKEVAAEDHISDGTIA